VSRRKLPLESPNWWPIREALKDGRQRIGSDKLVAQDFNQALKTDRLGALVRYADGSREVLPASAWNNLYVGGWVGLLVVKSRELDGASPPGQVFYVWRPDYEKIFVPVAAVAEPRAQSQEVPMKRGPKPVHNRADLQSVALVFALQRKQGVPEKKQTDVVDELREWCKRTKRKVPVPSTLYDIVAAAYRLKPTLKS
jgi:hypothetical protein